METIDFKQAEIIRENEEILDEMDAIDAFFQKLYELGKVKEWNSMVLEEIKSDSETSQRHIIKLYYEENEASEKLGTWVVLVYKDEEGFVVEGSKLKNYETNPVDREDYDITQAYFVEGDLGEVWNFFGELEDQFYDWYYDDVLENFPEWAHSSPWEIDPEILDAMIAKISKKYKVKVRYGYDERMNWNKKGYALYFLLGYDGREGKDEVELEIETATYAQAYDWHAKGEWEEHCKQLYKDTEHPFYEGKFDSTPIPFYDPVYAKEFPEWGKILKAKKGE
ncbi:hypothetical protein CHH61_03615 [Shouchella clausii]|uniref:Uncharacterized protein n=1 Tax=Shouchella clausii TaxID=79880 RepID=A0A268S4D9_SHOCL|nr:hypothetical protein [Shouchella clausii]PAF27418.1 hypothetical protein CHH61_03615 [Shouchella clausii]